MDYNNRANAKKGSGGIATSSHENLQRRERLKQLALETLDVSKDPYIHSISPGRFECRLCLTIHASESAYLTHTQGKKHQQNLARRRKLDDTGRPRLQKTRQGISTIKLKRFDKIGKPSFKTTKLRDQDKFGLIVNVQYPRIASDVEPRFRFMSAFEQHVEASKPQFQYLAIAAEPYDTIGIRLPAEHIDTSTLWSHFNKDTGEFYIQFLWPSGVLVSAR